MGHPPCLKHGIVLKGFYRTAAYGKQGGKKNGGKGYGNNSYDIPGFICTEGFIGKTADTLIVFHLKHLPHTPSGSESFHLQF